MPNYDFLSNWAELARSIERSSQPPGAVATIAFMGHVTGLIAKSSDITGIDQSDFDSTINALMVAANEDISAYFGSGVSAASGVQSPAGILRLLTKLRVCISCGTAGNEIDLHVALNFLQALESAVMDVIAHNISTGTQRDVYVEKVGNGVARLPGIYPDQGSLAAIQSANGVWLTDEHGEHWFDASSGMWNVPLGHGAQAPLAGFLEQALTVAAVDPFQTTTAIADRVADVLTELCAVPEGSVWFVSSGSEAVESAMRLGLAASSSGTVWSLPNEFHGSTAGAASLSSFGPVWSPFRESQRLSRVAPAGEWVAPGVGIFEPVSGVSGCVGVSEETLNGLRAFQRAGGILVADEVACGLGRAAWPTVSQQMGISPDIVLLGKGLGNGVSPVACIIATSETCAKATAHGGFDDGHTHSNHPASLGAAFQTLVSLRAVDFRRQEATFRAALDEAGVRTTGQGFFRAVHGRAVERSQIREALIKCRLMVHMPTSLSMCSSLILAPPVVLTHDEAVTLANKVQSVTDILGWT